MFKGGGPWAVAVLGIPHTSVPRTTGKQLQKKQNCVVVSLFGALHYIQQTECCA